MSNKIASPEEVKWPYHLEESMPANEYKVLIGSDEPLIFNPKNSHLIPKTLPDPSFENAQRRILR